MADVFLLLASLATAALGVVLIMVQRKLARRELKRVADEYINRVNAAAARRERWLTSDEYINRVNAAQTEEDLRRAQEEQELPSGTIRIRHERRRHRRGRDAVR